MLERDPICRECKQAPSLEVDHIRNSDDHRLSNLQGLCVPCHKAKTDREKNRIHLDRKRPRAKHPGER